MDNVCCMMVKAALLFSTNAVGRSLKPAIRRAARAAKGKRRDNAAPSNAKPKCNAKSRVCSDGLPKNVAGQCHATWQRAVAGNGGAMPR